MRQAESAECGIAALAIVMGYHGVHVPLDTLRERAGSTQHGLTARRLLVLAREFGFVAKGFSCDIGDLAELGLPLIAHFRFSHYLVVERIGPQAVRVNDPIDGPRSLSRDEFSRGFTGVALSVAPAAATKRSGRAFSARRELWQRLRPAAFPLAAAFGLSGASAACLVGAATAGGLALDHIIMQQPAAGVVSLAAVASIAAIACAGAAERIVAGAVRKAARNQIGWAIRRLARLPQAYFANRLPSQVIAKAQAALVFADTGLATAVLQLPALAILCAAVLWFGRWSGMAIVAISGVEFALIASAMLSRGSRMALVDSMQLPIVGPSRAVLAARDTWQVGDGGEALFGRLARHHALAMANALHAAEGLAALGAARTLLYVARITIAVVALAYHGSAEALPGAAAFVACAIAIGTSLDRFAEGFVPARLRRALHDLADLGNAAVPDSNLLPRQQPDSDRQLVLTGVGWAPTPGVTPIVSGISFALEAGTAIAICGPSASGKSVLAQLVAGHLAPRDGTITLGGVAPSVLPPGKIILLDRQPRFIAASIRDNLGKAGEDATLGELLDALGIGVPLAARGGLDLFLTEHGHELAASERYGLAIARALLLQPMVLVFDDALHALDPAMLHRVRCVAEAHAVTLVVTGRRAPADMSIDRVLLTRPIDGAAG